MVSHHLFDFVLYYQNDKSIITRIETDKYNVQLDPVNLDQNDKSIITRIETPQLMTYLLLVMTDQNDKSIITRIETSLAVKCHGACLVSK